MSTTLQPHQLSDEQPIQEIRPGTSTAVGETPVSLLVYLALGTFFGIVMTKSEAVSWFRIQEMFRFRSFHMYGIIATAIAVAALSLFLVRRAHARTIRGEPIMVAPKDRTPLLRRYWMGGITFGLGWGLLGACPGPIFALLGAGIGVIAVALVAALFGTWAYAHLAPRLPH